MAFLDKTSLNLLSSMQKLYASCPENNVFTYEGLAEVTQMPQDTVIDCLNLLEIKGLTRTIYYEPSHIGAGASLTHYGKHLKEFNRLERSERWKERLIGFVSGVATSVASGLVLYFIFGIG